MKIIQVPLTEYDANILQVALSRSDLTDFFKAKDSDIAASFSRLYDALVKAINDSW